jgi:predicted ATPase/class 3 adenylate cyclase
MSTGQDFGLGDRRAWGTRCILPEPGHESGRRATTPDDRTLGSTIAVLNLRKEEWPRERPLKGVQLGGSGRSFKPRVRAPSRLGRSETARETPLVRGDLPTGTVTFLFTDIEGSTKLLRELGAQEYANGLAEHRRIVREACAVEGGVEVDTQGDAFFFAFPSAPGAVAAARAMTGALADGEIHLRIGLHTGTPLVTDEGYVGDDVHFAARVAASGHGGQVLLSKSARELVDRLFVTDLGEHRLKDIEEAVSIYQLGNESFPPLKTISNTNLPRPASSFVGRKAELEAVLGRIEQGARLLTLTGPGGSGKTRLALEAATTLVPEYKAGVFWVGLAALRDATLVTEQIAQTLGAKDGLAEHIGERELLLLLDNLEQVIEAAPQLSKLLQACPNLTLLCTSRELLRVQGEVEYEVPPLAAPEAVALFCARSNLGRSEEIANLCARLDNLPLAVELAAARTKALSPAQIVDRLSSRLDLLQGGRDADPRQQTLRATMEWSYDLLPDEEQRLFRALSVFNGGCTLAAAEEVADADLDTMQSLVEKSLLRFTNERYWMLETVREFALSCLSEKKELPGSRQQHGAYFHELAVDAHAELRGPNQVRWLDALEYEIGNLRAALSWALEQRECALGLTLASSLERFWPAHGRAVEALVWFDRLLEACVANVAVDIRARATWVAGRQAMQLHRLARAEDLFLQAEPLLRRSGERETLVFCLCELSSIRRRIDASEATRFAEEALATARQLSSPRALSAALYALADDAASHDNYGRALALHEESLALRRGLDDPTAVVSSLYAVALAAFALGDEERARAGFAECLQLTRELGHLVMVAASAANLGYLELSCGKIEDARALLREGLRIFSEIGDDVYAADCLSGVATVAAALGRPLIAVRLWAAVDVFLGETGGELDKIDAAARNRFEPSALAALNPSEREQAIADGMRTSLDDAIQLALGPP